MPAPACGRWWPVLLVCLAWLASGGKAVGAAVPYETFRDPPLLGPPPEAQPPSPFQLKFDYESRTTADSTRKDYARPVYTMTSLDPVVQPWAYDKTFLSYETDLQLALKWTFTDTQFFDIKETLWYRHFRPEDRTSFTLDTQKVKSLDHLLNVTYGLAVGEADAFQLDYFHNAYRLPSFSICDYTSHLGKARFNHQIDEFAALGMEGTFEERQYHDDPSQDYREGALTVDFSKFLPERLRYIPVSNATRGDRETFERSPTGVDHRRVMEYYTHWTRKPGEDEPEARYRPEVTRGDLYVFLAGDFRTRERTTIDNGHFQPQGRLRIDYDVVRNVRVTLDEVYYKRRYEKESAAHHLFNHDSNRVSLRLTYRTDPRFTYYYTLSDERYRHDRYKEFDYRVDTFAFETWYWNGRSIASLHLRGDLTRYGSPRLYFCDSDRFQAVLGYDYPITPSFRLHLRDEWIDHDYHDFEDPLYSSYVRHTWRVAVEKVLSRSQGLELGYQYKRETHTLHPVNDQTEKSLFFSWLSHF
ncbi:MAG: hypothetical protein OZSIB_1201 [Candidatus Ozemobacter sibiricus]|uniref:Uncharacterized protein n=1 Tax=Candidatus Ozemobacter sibiricus TaxID=2268124 RepID=A0A367ZKQ0_9BACT|nr:MAG: hypothetical protein OZSIB_1201 [Candidatus Ozemobacter sibiricus]